MATEPHLHFQPVKRNSPLVSEGLPYALAECTIGTGRVRRPAELLPERANFDKP